ncbi:hypothetical protein CERSUDRAFT_90202 [Gelatoporia subvermispora B]|uniref:BTB domain-containing protein n=1 Tax=Ceriporiopsis subvermispora (strain B) TaxID=914234 RepID=M2RB15_CERS8|nr:hypothetical protein CERSUDRAFT_90202 [Gelatoporia subvermispora B]
MSCQTTEHSAYVQPPFNDPGGDIVIRTADGVDFRLLKALLSLTSPVFKDIQDGLTVVPIPDQSRTWDNLMRIIYPITKPEFPAIDHVVAALQASSKYEMREIHSVIAPYLTPYTDNEPLRVFAIAYQHGLQAQMQAAAHATLRRNVTAILSDIPCECDQLPVRIYAQLLRFHHKTNEAIDQKFADPNWILNMRPPMVKGRTLDFTYSILWLRSHTCSAMHPTYLTYRYQSIKATITPPLWWMEFLDKAKNAVKTHMKGTAVNNPTFAIKAMNEAAGCKEICQTAVPLYLPHVIDRMTKEIDAFLETLRFELEPDQPRPID